MLLWISGLNPSAKARDCSFAPRRSRPLAGRDESMVTEQQRDLRERRQPTTTSSTHELLLVAFDTTEMCKLRAYQRQTAWALCGGVLQTFVTSDTGIQPWIWLAFLVPSGCNSYLIRDQLMALLKIAAGAGGITEAFNSLLSPASSSATSDSASFCLCLRRPSDLPARLFDEKLGMQFITSFSGL
ncbi:hypothetical protein BZA77DRAFT_365257 [Pyronema omphalodes]|nr:hypothetical protein BZA77DRAFT_365257 [Pyronema omphalodes]